MATPEPPASLEGRRPKSARGGAHADRGGADDSAGTIRALLDAVPDFAMLIDRDLRIVAANQAVARHFATTVATLTGPEGRGAIPPEALSLRTARVEAAFTTGEPQLFETEREGRTYEDRIYPIAGRDGKPALLACYTRDVTERKRDEEDLRRYAGMVDTSPELIVVLDLDYRYRLVNEAHVRAHGRSRRQLVGRTVAEVLGNDAFERVIKSRLDRAFAGETSQWEGWHEFPGTGRRYMNASYHPYSDPDGEIVGAVVSARDLTELHLTREGLLANERRLLLSLESAQAGAWEWDMASGKAIWTNAQYHLLEWEPGEVEATYETWLTRVHPDDRARVNETVERALKSTGELDFECRVLLPTRGKRWIRTIGRVSKHPDGGVAGLYGIQFDVSDRKRADVERERLLTDLRALSARLSAVEEEERLKLSRELHDQAGQTLAALSVTLGLVRAQLSEESPLRDRLDDALTLVEETSGRVRDVMADLRPPVLDEYGLMAALDWLADWVAARADVEILVNGEEPSPRLDSASELSLFRIAQEALTNVLRHAEAGTATIDLRESDGRIELMVSDDGVGFEPDATESAGEPRHWGLMSMRERAAALGGTLEIDSEPGVGTRVRVTLER